MNEIEKLSSLTSIEGRYKILSKFDDLTLDQESLEKWREEMSILDDESFNRMLQFYGYDLVTFSNAVRSDVMLEFKNVIGSEVLSKEWYKNYLKIMKLANGSEVDTSGFNGTYAAVMWEFLYYMECKMLDQAARLTRYKISNECINSLISCLSIKLLDIVLKAVMAELHSKKEDNSSSEADKFNEFISSFLIDSRKQAFLEKYPMLKYYLTNQTILLTDYLLEIIDNIEDDLEDIYGYFDTSFTTLVDISLGKGDSHCGNKSVAILSFNDKLKLVYKPKRLDIVEAYNEFINWLNKNTNIKKLHFTKILVRENYSYEEFVNHRACLDADEVKEFYEKFGQLIGIVYFLNGNDIHMENLIAVGSEPILIDLETLIQQPFIFSEDVEETATYSFNALGRTLMLPGVYVGLKEKLDFSAMSGGTKDAEYTVFAPVDLNSENARYENVKVKQELGMNVPYIGDEPQNFLQYTEEIITGFSNVGLALLKQKKKLKPLMEQWFNGKTIRILMKATDEYSRIINHLYHPDMLKDYLDLDKVVENMWVDKRKQNEIIYAEAEDMRICDVPFFTMKTDSTEIFDSRNKPILASSVKITPYKYLKKSMDSIDEYTIKSNAEVIRYGLGNYINWKNASFRHYNKSKEPIKNLNRNLNRDNLFRYIKNIVAGVEDSLFQLDGNLVCQVLNEVEEGVLKVALSGNGIYTGICGLLNFLMLSQVRGYTNGALDCNKEMKKRLKKEIILLSKNGLHMETGAVYSLYLLDRVIDNAEYKDLLGQAVSTVNDNLLSGINENKAYELEYLNGLSSYLTILTKLENKDDGVLQTIHVLSEYIREKAKIESMELGLAHEINGYVTLWHRVCEVTKNEKDLEFLKALEMREFSLLNASKKLNNHWCRGNVGVAFSLLSRLEKTGKEEYQQGFEMVLSRIEKHPMAINDCYCHGNSATIDLYLEAFRIYGKRDFLLKAESLSSQLFSNFKKNGSYMLHCEKTIVDVSMFTGLAGIGYVAMRLTEPNKIPSLTIL